LVSLLDVLLLCGFVAATQQQDQTVAVLCEVDPVAGTGTQAQFEHALSDRLHITRIPVGEAIDPLQDPQPALPVLQLSEPTVEALAGVNLDHVSTITDTTWPGTPEGTSCSRSDSAAEQLMDALAATDLASKD